jgi:hypothetical protein
MRSANGDPRSALFGNAAPAKYYLTVRVALLLVTLPALLLTTTEKREPLSPVVVGGVV